MHQIYSIHRTELFVKSFRSCVDVSMCGMVELATILAPMCYGKHKVLPILWMARDSHKFFRPDSYQEPFPKKSKSGSILFHYRSHNHLIKEVKSFLASEESQSMKKKFSSIVSELVTSDKEREKIFNAAFKSFIKSLSFT